MEVVRVDMQVAVAADIVVTGRNVEVPAHYRVHIAEKLARLERYGSHVSRIVRYDVVLDHENNPRLSKVCQRVEITGRGTGPTVRAEACGPDFRSVLDAAVAKLQETLRRSHDHPGCTTAAINPSPSPPPPRPSPPRPSRPRPSGDDLDRTARQDQGPALVRDLPPAERGPCSQSGPRI